MQKRIIVCSFLFSLVFCLVLPLVLPLVFPLSAQQFQEPSGTIINPDKPETRFVITGLGFDISFPLLTQSGQNEFDGLSGYDVPFHMVQTIRLHLALAFVVDHVYALGFATYLLVGHQNSDVKNGSVDQNSGKVSNDLIVGRGFLIFSPAFYNQLSLGQSFILHLAVGPSLLFSFLDYKDVKTGNKRTVVTRKDSVDFGVDFDLGLYLVAGFQLRFGRGFPKVFGMSLEFTGNLFFTGRKGQEFASGDVVWNGQQVYLGSLGAALSFLLFL